MLLRLNFFSGLQVCLISGANRGFGQAIAIRFVEQGAKVVCFSRSGQSSEELFLVPSCWAPNLFPVPPSLLLSLPPPLVYS